MWDSPLYAANIFYCHWLIKIKAASSQWFNRVKPGGKSKQGYIEKGSGVKRVAMQLPEEKDAREPVLVKHKPQGKI